MKIGHATVVGTEPLDEDRTLVSFAYGTKGPADNHLTVDVLDDDEWGWEDEDQSAAMFRRRLAKLAP